MCGFITDVKRIESNEHNKDYEELGRNIVKSVKGQLAASSLSNKKAKIKHAHLLRSRHALRENGCH
jgi:ribosomal protein L14